MTTMIACPSCGLPAQVRQDPGNTSWSCRVCGTRGTDVPIAIAVAEHDSAHDSPSDAPPARPWPLPDAPSGARS